MNRDDIIRMALEADLCPWVVKVPEAEAKKLERFAALVAAAERGANLQQIEIIVEAAVAAEREACAQVCESLYGKSGAVTISLMLGSLACAAAIRARGEK